MFTVPQALRVLQWLLSQEGWGALAHCRHCPQQCQGAAPEPGARLDGGVCTAQLPWLDARLLGPDSRLALQEPGVGKGGAYVILLFWAGQLLSLPMLF